MKETKWAVLGDMLELGEHEQRFHEELAGSIGPELEGVCLYGPRMKWLYDKLAASYEGKLLWSEDDYGPIIDLLKKNVKKDTAVLVKGSRGMALEKVIEPFTGQ